MAVASPGGSAQISIIQPCGNTVFHTYNGAGGASAFLNESDEADESDEPRYQPDPWLDTCAIGTGNPNDFDHDFDWGLGSGMFHASSTCGPAIGTSAPPQTPGYSWNPHHAFSPWSRYTADQQGPGVIAYGVGTDGPLDATTNPCQGNGIVSNDPTTDPNDCGSGQIGFDNTMLHDRPALIGPNDPTSSCDPADGYAWVTIFAGPIVFCNNAATTTGACVEPNPPGDIPPAAEGITSGEVFLSTPTWGIING